MTKLRRINKMIVSLMIVCSLFAGNVLAAEKDIVVKGSTTVLPISQACAEVFMDQNASVNISVQGGGSGVGNGATVDSVVPAGVHRS